MSKASIREVPPQSFTPIELTIELTTQLEVDALHWFANTSLNGLVAMNEARNTKEISRDFLQTVSTTASKLIRQPLSSFAGK
jgi:hypothetical protein